MRKGLHTPARKPGSNSLQKVLAQGTLPGPATNKEGGTPDMMTTEYRKKHIRLLKRIAETLEKILEKQ